MKRTIALIFVTGLITSGAYAAELLSSPEDAATFNTCKAMKAPERNASAACKAVMQKTKVTSSDMDKMKACESPQADVNKDPNCQAMLAKHPEVARGHGRLEPDINDNKMGAGPAAPSAPKP